MGMGLGSGSNSDATVSFPYLCCFCCPVDPPWIPVSNQGCSNQLINGTAYCLPACLPVHAGVSVSVSVVSTEGAVSAVVLTGVGLTGVVGIMTEEAQGATSGAAGAATSAGGGADRGYDRRGGDQRDSRGGGRGYEVSRCVHREHESWQACTGSLSHGRHARGA